MVLHACFKMIADLPICMRMKSKPASWLIFNSLLLSVNHPLGKEGKKMTIINHKPGINPLLFRTSFSPFL